MEQKFKPGDVVKVRSGSETMTVVEYEVNSMGGLMNAFSRENKYPDSIITDNIMCEWMYRGKKMAGKFKESSLELVKPFSE
jgi:uncharacterized protein YodC (DUF2158 family)